MQSISKLRRITGLIGASTNSELMLHQLDILLRIAEAGSEAISFAELGQLMGLSRAAISRNMKLFGKSKAKVKGQWQDVGYDLIDIRPYPYDTRAYAAVLSPKGKALMKQINQIMGEGNGN